MNVRIVVLFAFVLSNSAGITRAADLLPETVFPELAPLLRQAVDQSPRMISRAIELEIAENDRMGARSAMLPNIGGYYRYYQTRDERADLVGGLDVEKTWYDLSITQPLFHWGERRNTARIGAINAQIAERNYRDAYRQLAQEIRNRYMQLIVQKLGLERARRNVAFGQQQLRLAEDRLAKKEIPEAAVATYRIAAERNQIGVEQAEYDFEMAKNSFARLVGVSRFEDSQIPDAIPTLDYQSNDVSNRLASFLSLQELPSVEAQNMRLKMKAEDLTYRNQKTRLLPKFNLVAGISQDEQSYTLNTAQKYAVDSIYGGISINWTLFDGFNSRAAVRNALARKRQTQNDYTQLVERVMQQAQTQSKGINFSGRLMSLADRLLRDSEGNLKTTQEQLSRGVATEVAVTQAELSLIDARMAAFNSRMDYLMKMGDFMGTLNEDPVLTNLPSSNR